MKILDTGFAKISIIDEKTVLVEAIEGVEINKEKAQQANQLIEEQMPDQYGMIIHRKTDYSIVPVEVYRVLNSMKNLKAIAIVVEKQRSFLPVEIEQRLFTGDLELFHSIDEAASWISHVVH